MIPNVSAVDINAALELFDEDFRSDPIWADWEHKRNYRYAVLHQDRRYPVKQVISLATNTPVDAFSGGEESNSYLTQRGFLSLIHI